MSKRFYLPVNGYEISHKIAGTAVKEKYQPQRSALPIILGSAIICPTENFALSFVNSVTTRSYLYWWQILMSVTFFLSVTNKLLASVSSLTEDTDGDHELVENTDPTTVFLWSQFNNIHGTYTSSKSRKYSQKNSGNSKTCF